jgi:hypothetical protein
MRDAFVPPVLLADPFTFLKNTAFFQVLRTAPPRPQK